jgi:hypothetical protein
MEMPRASAISKSVTLLFKIQQPCLEQETYSQEPVIVKTEFGLGKKSGYLLSGHSLPHPNPAKPSWTCSCALIEQAEATRRGHQLPLCNQWLEIN